ncbi:hypothetical protein BOX15_Mlig021912g1 [Macrostomum lignano]|uniref:Uncharacterized protein n=1 Tax=Macrostomum lignano TaxID=282301 RepID=A0A267DHQ6_9PLAT|nr:hypothetical protein BOX15_Mlig021912g1 [Macrostomum lignano]
MDGGEESVELEGLISLLFQIFKDDIEGLIDIGNIVAVYENHIKNAHPTQGIFMNRPSSWSELLQAVSQLPIEDAFSQLLRCITSSTQENLLHHLHLDNRRDLPRLHRLQLSVPASLPAALQRDVFAQSLQDFSKSSEDLDGDGSAAHVHCVLHQLINCAPHDWFEHLILAAIADLESSVDLLDTIAPFGQDFESELPALQPKLYNTVSSPEFKEAKKSVVDQSNRWFDLNGLKFDSDTYKLERVANQQPPSASGSQPSGNNELVGGQLRDYQLELAEPALLDRNSIVIAPTGSGKTLVAVHVTLQLLKAEPQAKVALLASTNQLVQQQYDKFRSALPSPWRDRVDLILGGKDNKNRKPFALSMKKNSIVVISTQILLNELDRKTVANISDFRLIIFDECHNCAKSHASMKVMMHYLRLKRDLEQENQSESCRETRLPQILGLTASPGTGKAKGPEDAKEHLVQLCANLDCPYPVTVQRYLQSLFKFNSDQDCQILSVPAKQSSEDVFIKFLNELMDLGEKLLYSNRSSLLNSEPEALQIASAPPRGTPTYTNYCSDVKYKIHQVADEEMGKDLFACSRYLDTFNQAYMIAQFYNPRGAWRYIKKELRAVDELAKSPVCEAESQLRQRLHSLIGPLERFCDTKEASSSPPLDKFVEILRNQFNSQADSRAIVFVQRKIYAQVITEFLNEQLPHLPAAYVTGATSSDASGGTNASEQQARIEGFRQGDYKVIACTSMAEEGLDIPDCNLVVRYCHVTNEIAMVQTKGRCRAKNSAYYVIVAETQEALRHKERENELRDAMMQQSVACVTDLTTEELVVKMLDYQEKALKDEEEKRANNSTPIGSDVIIDSDHEILCCKCKEKLSDSTRLRLICGIHRVVLDADMFTGGQRIVGQHGGEIKKVPGMDMIGVDLLCGYCSYGPVAKIARYKGQFFPLLDPECVCFRRLNDKKLEKQVRKWKHTKSFLRDVAELSSDDRDYWRRAVPRLPRQYRAAAVRGGAHR